MAQRSPGEWIDEAAAVGEFAEIVAIADAHRDDLAIQRQAAAALRNLLRFDELLPIVERITTMAPRDYRALESRALALGRVRPPRYAEALEMLEEAERIAEGHGEARALAGRLRKQKWRTTFERRPEDSGPLDVAGNEDRAREDHENLFAAIEAYLRDFQLTGRQDYYPAINALTLLTLAECLVHAAPPDGWQGWPAQAMEAERLSLARDLAVLVDRATQGAAPREERYWVIATAAELALVAPPEVRKTCPPARQLLKLALECDPAPYLFELDSTIQQLELFESLGYQLTQVREALKDLRQAVQEEHKRMAKAAAVRRQKLVDRPPP